MAGKDGGWRLPAVIDPENRICTCIPVPDEPAHRQAFWGALTELGYQHNWERNAGHDAVPVSVLWMAIVAQAQAKFYSGVRTMCFSCEELADCLAPLLEGLSNQIIQQMTFNQYGTPYPTGVPLPEEAVNADVAPGSNPTCDYDILWAQCWQAVTYADILITDALELAESATNDVELVQVITALPVIDELGGDAIAAYIEVMLEGIQDNYFAQVTEAYLQDAACDLFCLCLSDCVVNLDRLYKIYYDRMVAAFGTPAEAFTTVTDLLLYVIDQEIEGSLIADALNMVIWGGGILSNQFLGDVGTTSLTALLQLAVNDANNDWETICDACPDVWSSDMDLTGSESYGWESYGGFTDGSGGEHVPGVGFVGAYGYAPLNAYQMAQMGVEIDPSTVTSIKFWFTIINGSNGGVPLYLGTNNALGTDEVMFNLSSTPPANGSGTFEGSAYAENAEIIAGRVQAGVTNGGTADPGGSVVVTRVRVTGEGPKPPQLP